MPHRDLYIAAYDVRDPKRLRHALYAVRGYATGGQKSVHECFLTATERRELIAEMKAILDTSEDNFALLRLDPRMAVTTLGIAVAPIDPPFFYQG